MKHFNFTKEQEQQIMKNMLEICEFMGLKKTDNYEESNRTWNSTNQTVNKTVQ